MVNGTPKQHREEVTINFEVYQKPDNIGILKARSKIGRRPFMLIEYATDGVLQVDVFSMVPTVDTPEEVITVLKDLVAAVETGEVVSRWEK